MSQTQSFRIGILSYNHPELTKRVLESCLKHFATGQITLLHNGSETRWVQQLQQTFPEVDHLVVEVNQGFTGGTNRLLTHCFDKAHWCLFLTNDVQLLKWALPVQEGLFAPFIYRRKIGVIDSIGGLFAPRSGRLEHCRHEHHFFHPREGWQQYVPGTAFWLDKNTFASAGPFDQSLGTYWEDVEYSRRLAAKDLFLGVAPQTELLHAVGKTCHKKKFYTSYLFQRNKYYVSLKYNNHYLSRILFRASYWTQWSADLAKAFWRGDQEVLGFKWRILQDLILKRVRPH
jgi:GT2 family glycosyltransferase